jgi:uncharacterized protein (TIGR03083 family)
VENVRSFASWVEPVALQLAADRRDLIAFVRNAPPDSWGRPSGVEGWTCHDLLAHVSGGNDQLLQILLRAVISGKPLGGEAFGTDTDEANARGVEARRSWPIERVIAELEEGGEEVQELLSQLTEAHRNLRSGAPMTLGDFLRIVHHERHDREHLEQLRAAMKGEFR